MQEGSFVVVYIKDGECGLDIKGSFSSFNYSAKLLRRKLHICYLKFPYIKSGEKNENLHADVGGSPGDLDEVPLKKS